MKIKTTTHRIFPEESKGIIKAAPSVGTFLSYLGEWSSLYEQAVEIGDIVSHNRLFYQAQEAIASQTTTYENLSPPSLQWSLFSPYVVYAYCYQDGLSLLSQPCYIPINDIADEMPLRSIVLSLMPTEFSGAVEKLSIYRRRQGEEQFYYVGSIKSRDRFIFFDDGKPNRQVMPCTDPDVEQYPDTIRWTTIGSASQVPLGALENIQFGDGDKITGLAVLYGNLIVFKENSIHRVSFNSPDINFPISRTDIISPDIGCIAPRTILTVNNTVFFLSWQGFYSYDNNQLQPVDAAFSVELQQRLHTIRNSWNSLDNNSGEAGLENFKTKSGFIDACSSAYNQQHNEIYLNVPIRFNPPARNTFHAPDGNSFLDGDSWQSLNYAPLDGNFAEFSNFPCTYVVSLTKGYTTKFTYMGTNVSRPESHGRLYHTNSIGELRSGRITGCYGHMDGFTNYMVIGPSEVFLESPTGVFSDMYLPPKVGVLGAENRMTSYYPSESNPLVRSNAPIVSVVRSKLFGSNAESMQFRLRKLIVEWTRSINDFRQGVHFLTYPVLYRDEMLNDLARRPMIQSFLDVPASKSSMGNIVSFTPKEVMRDISLWIEEGDYKARDTEVLADFLQFDETEQFPHADDVIGKPVHFAFDIVSVGKIEIHGYTIYTRPIHGYLS